MFETGDWNLYIWGRFLTVFSKESGNYACLLASCLLESPAKDLHVWFVSVSTVSNFDSTNHVSILYPKGISNTLSLHSSQEHEGRSICLSLSFGVWMHEVFSIYFLKASREQFHVCWPPVCSKPRNKEFMFAVLLALLEMIEIVGVWMESFYLSMCCLLSSARNF